jgi:hypothetical protein
MGAHVAEKKQIGFCCDHIIYNHKSLLKKMPSGTLLHNTYYIMEKVYWANGFEISIKLGIWIFNFS